MIESLQSLLREQRITNPPRFVWRDWFLVAAVLVATVIEVSVRDDINAVGPALLMILAMGCSLPWRRTHPLEVGAGVLGSIIVFDIVFVIAGYGPLNLYAAAFLLIVVYSTFRWGSGRDMAIVWPLSIGLFIVSELFDHTGVGDAISGFFVLHFPIAVALAIRFVGRSREQAKEQIRVSERERLARELHDTVAHHMSAIAIQAQAGRFVAESGSLDGATQALEIIEEEASRTLAEMRSIVGTLRDRDTPVEMMPRFGIDDIEALASSTGTPVVATSVEHAAHQVGPAVGAALYRIAQESITNARLHAVNPSTIDVRVTRVPDGVQLVVTDDGAATPAKSRQGFGIIGMTERATLLGGALVAGPGPQKGWQVTATLPFEHVR